jgi:tetratricopeptide (TPR) repeat protein
MRRNLALSLTLLLLTATQAFAGAEARLSGKIIDGATKEPIANSELNVEAVEGKTVKLGTKAKKDGNYALFLLDGTIRYKLTYSAPGYDPYVETLKLNLGPNNTKNIELFKTGTTTTAAAPTGATAVAKVDTTVVAYNEGAALANAGDVAGAIAKFEQAVAAKPDLLAGWMALAKMQLRQKNYDKAIEAAGKVLEIDDSDISMITVMHEAYAAKGDKANTAKYSALLPKNANALYNDAAKMINTGNDAGAETLLKQAIEVDASFGQAYYELGMIYVRSGKSGEAKSNLQKYLELDPNGRDAATAKEMMQYLK